VGLVETELGLDCSNFALYSTEVCCRLNMAGFTSNLSKVRMMKSQETENHSEFEWYLNLLCTVYSDVADASPAQHRTEFDRDVATLRRRFEHEGISFLTKVLPSVGKAIDTALSSGSALQVPSFAKRRGSHLPICFGWLLEQVFGSDGVELADASPIALGHIRQLLGLFYKLELPFSDESVQRVLNDFIITDSQLQNNWILNYDDKHILQSASNLVARVLGGQDPTRIIPRHGPGAVATREKGPGKSVFHRQYRSLEEVYPFTDYFFFNLSHLCDRLRSRAYHTESPELDRDRNVTVQRDGSEVVYGTHREVERPRGRTLYSVDTVQCPELVERARARVVLVPKDSRGPRLISMEPLEIQWIQQGQMRLMVETIEKHPLTNGQVNFSNQEVNRALALEASRHGNLVTLDMKEASDRVSQHLVWTLFPLNWVRCLEASRSPETELPCGRILELQKFAPMGSAVCFPIEALSFWALAVSCLMAKYPHQPMHASAKAVWVYGDDIIVYRKDYPDIMQFMEKVGLLFNQSKCCTHGFFRESCGMDAFRGTPVTPLRIRKRWCHRLVVPTLESYCSYSDALYSRGYYQAAAYIEEYVQSLARVPYTTVPASGISLVRPEIDVVSATKARGIRIRFNPNLHRLEFNGWATSTRMEPSPFTDWEELLRSLSSSDRLRVSSDLEMPFSRSLSNRDWALNEKSKSSRAVSQAGLYSDPRRVTSKRGWHALV